MANKICTIQNCNNIIRCRGLCTKHYSASKFDSTKQQNYDRTPNRRFNRYKATCKRKQIPFCITFEQWQNLIKDNKCYYCPNTLPTVGIALDRKYPEIGYFNDNVVPCCKDCNNTKRDRFSHIEYKIMMDALNEFRKRL